MSSDKNSTMFPGWTEGELAEWRSDLQRRNAEVDAEYARREAEAQREADRVSRSGGGPQSPNGGR